MSFGYDGPLLSQQTWKNRVSGNVSWTYNNLFQIDTEQVNGQSSVTYGYDADGLVTSVGPLTIARDASTGTVTGTFSGTAGLEIVSKFNAYGELASTVASDHNGAVFSDIDDDGASHPRDALGRVRHESVTTSSDSYTVDDGYSYTPNGDLSRKQGATGTTTYHYDALGNLTGVDLPGGSQVQYIVDALGRRVEKSVGGSVSYELLYRDGLHPIAEPGAGGLYDQDTGLVRFGARDYDPQSQRWTAPSSRAGGRKETDDALPHSRRCNRRSAGHRAAGPPCPAPRPQAGAADERRHPPQFEDQGGTRSRALHDSAQQLRRHPEARASQRRDVGGRVAIGGGSVAELSVPSAVGRNADKSGGCSCVVPGKGRTGGTTNWLVLGLLGIVVALRR